MAIKLPFGITKTHIAFIISLLLNLLGGTGTIQPLMGDTPDCPPAPSAPAPVVAPIH